MNKRVFASILAIMLFFSGFIKVGATTRYHEVEVEEYIIKQLAAANIPGVSLSIVTSQKEVYSASFGDVKETESNLQIGALTKTFTTLAIMQLVEKGDLSLDDSVYQYIPARTYADLSSGISVQDLLSYVPHNKNFADEFDVYNSDTNLRELSVNAKFNLLGQIIEKASGMTYATYIVENIAKPLDMQSTYTVGENRGTITHGSKNYFGLPLKSKRNVDSDYWLGVPSNGIISNVKDMGKYMQMYLSAGGKVVSYNAIESIMGGSQVAGKSIFGTDAYYSMGWTVTEKNDKEIYYCKGCVEDYTSAMFIIPSMDIGITMLFSSADALAGQEFTDDIEAGVVSLVMGDSAKAVSSKKYFMKHMIADIMYVMAVAFAFMPLLLMEVWTRLIRGKYNVVRLSSDAALHIILPVALIFIVRHSVAPWGVIKKVMPDFFCVGTIVIGLLYFGGLVKLIMYYRLKHCGVIDAIDEEIDEEEENEREIQERREKLRKRMDDIKKAEMDSFVSDEAREAPAEKP